MTAETCFGKLFDANESLCSADSCDAREECRKAMMNVEERKLRCMGTFDSRNRACTDACTKVKECQELTKAVDKKPEASRLSMSTLEVTVPVIEVTVPVPKPEAVEPEAVEPVTTSGDGSSRPSTSPSLSELEKLDNIHEVGLPSGTTAGPSSMSNLGTTSTSSPKTGKVSKKSIVRDNIRSLKRFKADDLVQAIVDAKLGEDTPEDRKKNRNLVTMWISEFKRENVFMIERDGDFYVLLTEM